MIKTKGIKRQYYLCAYGHVIRISDKCDDEHQAARECFGVTDRVTTFPAGTRKDILQSPKKRQELIDLLIAKHKVATGNDVTSY